MAKEEKNKFIEEFRQRVDELTTDEKKGLNRSNRRDILLLGVPMVLMLAAVAIFVARGKYFLAGIDALFAVYLALFIVQNRLINQQRYTINMLVGVREIDDEVRHKLMEDLDASANEKRNRKK